MAENRKIEIESWKKKNKEQRKIYRENIKQWKEWSKGQTITKVGHVNKVDITRDMKIKEIVDIMQSRYDALLDTYNKSKIKYVNTFVEMNNKLEELQKGQDSIES